MCLLPVDVLAVVKGEDFILLKVAVCEESVTMNNTRSDAQITTSVQMRKSLLSSHPSTFSFTKFLRLNPQLNVFVTMKKKKEKAHV